jgi:hypothetical protein
MPALFAYLIVVGLLLGGGYGALSWLAAPEPVKVVAKAKSKPHPRYEASTEAASLETSALTVGDGGRAGFGSNDHALAAQSGPGREGEQGGEATISDPAADLQFRSAHAEVASGEATRHIEAAAAVARQEVRQPAPALSPPSNARTAVTKPIKRSHIRQASGHSEKSAERQALTLMTLRTIEFPDGRRVTRLIPYRGGERVLAFGPDD